MLYSGELPNTLLRQTLLHRDHEARYVYEQYNSAMKYSMTFSPTYHELNLNIPYEQYFHHLSSLRSMILQHTFPVPYLWRKVSWHKVRE